MAKKRFTDIEIWDKEWFMELSPKIKCLVRYLFDKCDAAGVWSPNWRLASMHIGETVTSEDLKAVPTDQYEILENGKIFIPSFINFQYGKISEASPAHKPIFKSIDHNNLSNRVFSRVFSRVCNTLQEKDKDMEEDKEEGGMGEKKPPEVPTQPAAPVVMNPEAVLPQMMTAWKKYNPRYPIVHDRDMSALGAIAGFICSQEGVSYQPRDGDVKTVILSVWEPIVVFVSNHKHFKSYSLQQVDKHIQSISQSFINESGNTGKGANGSSKVTGAQLHTALAQFRGKKPQPAGAG